MIHKNQTQFPDYITAQMNFIFRARILWRDLASWLRAYMISLYAGIGDLEAVSQRLYRIPLEYNDMLKLFFGDKICERHIALLSNYIILMESLFTELKNNNIDAVNNLTQQLYQNVNDQSVFHASINPFWTVNEWQSLLTSFTSMNIDQAISLLTKDYAKYIDIYDRILTQTSVIGDYFSEGLISYFNQSAPQLGT